MTDLRIALTTRPQPMLERVAIETENTHRLPEDVRDHVSIDVIHDGNWVPSTFMVDREGRPIDQDALEPDYIRERDWGASLVAEALGAALGVTSYARVNVARVLLDFGRFPGSTPEDAGHLDRFAINYPFSELLSYRQKKHLLELCYDGISHQFESHLAHAQLKIAVHTYDQYNKSGTERPAVSLLTRTLGYQNHSEMPEGLFDPLYPDALIEFTADRVLRDRVSLTLEKLGIPVAHNYPYLLPEGSLEVRYQVWSFFKSLKQRYLEDYPLLRDDSAHAMVWEMLLDTNLRSSESEALRSFLHMYRRAPEREAVRFEAAADAYERISAFAHREHDALIDNYRRSPERASSLAVEVRKDLVCEMDAAGRPLRPRHDNIQYIVNALAQAITQYYTHDRLQKSEPTHFGYAR